MSESDTEQEIENRRLSERKRCFRHSRVVFNNGASSVECVVRDVSEKGARLLFTDTLGVPSEFDLSTDEMERRCLVKWRSNFALGVEFVAE